MDDCISRQAAIGSAISGMTMTIGGEKWIRVSEVRESLYSVPSAQPRKKGKWIYKPNIYGVAYCSECDFELHINDTPYCPNCGAEMKGEEDAKSM